LGCHTPQQTPIVTPIEAAITQQQLNGRQFLFNLTTLAKQKALHASLPAGLLGAVPKAVVHYSFLTVWSQLLAPGGDLNAASPLRSAAVGSAVGATEVWLVNPLQWSSSACSGPSGATRGSCTPFAPFTTRRDRSPSGRVVRVTTLPAGS